MAATDQQIQNFVDQRWRGRCEAIRNLAHLLADDIAQVGDVYAALTAQSPTWKDARTDAPPGLLTGADVLAINTAVNDLYKAITTNAQWPIIQKACVKSVLQ